MLARRPPKHRDIILSVNMGRCTIERSTVSPHLHTIRPIPEKGTLIYCVDDKKISLLIWKSRENEENFDETCIGQYEVNFKKVNECPDGTVYIMKDRDWSVENNSVSLFWLQDPEADRDGQLANRFNEELNTSTSTRYDLPPMPARFRSPPNRPQPVQTSSDSSGSGRGSPEPASSEPTSSDPITVPVVALIDETEAMQIAEPLSLEATEQGASGDSDPTLSDDPTSSKPTSSDEAGNVGDDEASDEQTGDEKEEQKDDEKEAEPQNQASTSSNPEEPTTKSPDDDQKK